MAVIHLIRHGQASFGKKDYDELSELGRRQADVLGAHLGRSRLRLDAVLSGQLRRQRDTKDTMLAALGKRAPRAEEHHAFNEYDHVAVIRAYLPLFMARVGEPRGITRADVVTDPKLFEFAFRFMLKAWMDTQPHEHGELEDWRDFCRRVGQGLSEVLATYGPKSQVAIVTSGGVISAMLRTVLGLSNKRTLSMNWSIYNASITQLYYGRSSRHEDALLLGFNNVAHLELAGGRELVTFR
ncbi:MAG: histidine phosphatase family protein [Gammaproteobacteria bacterium]|jgi:broad specificity phosphatase PhoE